MAKLVKTASSLYTEEDLVKIRMYPHILGWIMGFTKMKPIHSKWILDMFGPDPTRFKKTWGHRGSFKSSAVIIGIVWTWIWKPEEQIGLYRKSFTDCVETISTIAKVMKMPEIRELFRFAHGEYPEFRKEKAGDGLLDFSFRKNPSVAPSILGMSKNSSLTGKHCSLLIPDDASDLKSRISRAERKQDQAIFRELTTNIVNKDGKIRLFGTPWCSWGSGGVEDLLVVDPKKGIQPCDNFKVYHIADIGLITPQELEEIRASTTPSLFNANYLMVFTSDESAVFTNPQEAPWDFENCLRPIGHLDAGFSKEGDGSAITIAALNKKTGKIHAVGYRFPGNVFDNMQAIAERFKEMGVRKVYVETNRDAGFCEKELRKLGFTASGYVESSNKNSKISVFGLEGWVNTIWDTDRMDASYLAELMEWQDLPSGAMKDDCADSYASLMRVAFSKKNSNSLRWTW